MPDALILGCSHAAGALMHKEPGLVLEPDGTKDVYQREAEYGAQRSYPVQLAEMLGYTAHNHAISGGSNDAMYRIYAEQEQHYDLIVACWTGPDRGEIWHNEHEYWVPINVGTGDSFTKTPSDVLKQGRSVLTKLKNFEQYEDYGKQWLTFEGNEQRGFNNKVKNILALNSLATSKDTRVINLEASQEFTINLIGPRIYTDHVMVTKTNSVTFVIIENFQLNHEGITFILLTEHMLNIY